MAHLKSPAFGAADPERSQPVIPKAQDCGEEKGRQRQISFGAVHEIEIAPHPAEGFPEDRKNDREKQNRAPNHNPGAGRSAHLFLMHRGKHRRIVGAPDLFSEMMLLDELQPGRTDYESGHEPDRRHDDDPNCLCQNHG
jgi:hypothetical protein